MAAKNVTHLTRLEARANAMRDEVFSEWLKLLPTEDLKALVEQIDANYAPLGGRAESWLMNASPLPALRPDLWRQAVTAVLAARVIEPADSVK